MDGEGQASPVPSCFLLLLPQERRAHLVALLYVRRWTGFLARLCPSDRPILTLTRRRFGLFFPLSRLFFPPSNPFLSANALATSARIGWTIVGLSLRLGRRKYEEQHRHRHQPGRQTAWAEEENDDERGRESDMIGVARD